MLLPLWAPLYFIVSKLSPPLMYHEFRAHTVYSRFARYDEGVRCVSYDSELDYCSLHARYVHISVMVVVILRDPGEAKHLHRLILPEHYLFFAERPQRKHRDADCIPHPLRRRIRIGTSRGRRDRRRHLGA